jgi:hypothetical protein
VFRGFSACRLTNPYRGTLTAAEFCTEMQKVERRLL